jgi:tRNA uridine 5-carbamoylmethylation protein Kti12
MLAKKFDMIIDQNDELTKKIELLEQTKTISKKASKSIFESKKDASTSFIDLIHESSSPSCNAICVENVVVETCDDLIAQENDKLKKELTRLTMDLTRLKKKESCQECKKQPSQDNHPKMVKKLEKEATMTCYSCHLEGHKSYECKNKKKKIRRKSTPTPSLT